MIHLLTFWVATGATGYNVETKRYGWAAVMALLAIKAALEH